MIRPKACTATPLRRAARAARAAASFSAPLFGQRSFSAAAVNDGRPQKVVIIGGVAGGATAAARLSRLSKDLEVTVIERSPDVSFANCGLPYYIGREITDRSKLALQTPESLSKSLGVNVLTNTEAVRIDRAAKTVSIRNLNGENRDLPYDKLILSPGASPLRPKVAGIDDPRVMTLRNLQDLDRMDHVVHKADCKRVAVIGAGFIGLEMVEQLHRLKKTVHLIERGAAVLPQADEDLASFLHAPLAENGVHTHLGDGLASFKATSSGIQVVLESGQVVEVDLAVLCIGVAPESRLAAEAQLTVTSRGHVSVNEFMQTNDPSIYSVGDVVETQDLVFPERRAAVALGNLANMQARIAADHMVLGRSVPYRGSLGTSIVRVFDTVLALTGWNEKRLKAAGIPYSTTTVTANAHAGYYPGALPLTMKITFDPQTGRLFGGQAVGIDGADKRIDVLATAITGGLTVDDLSLTQLCYSPPFGAARDVVNVAGLAARNIRDGLVNPAASLDEPSQGGKKVVLLDVRPRENASLSPLPGSVNIPHGEIRSRIAGLDRSAEYRTVCALGKTAYFSSRDLALAGLQTSTLIGGLRVHSKPKVEPPTAPSSSSGSGPAASESAVVRLDCSGLACPGPLLKLREAVQALPNNTVLQVTATDPGFKADVRAFAASNGLTLTGVTSDRGIIQASLVKGAPTPAAPAASSAVAVGPRKGATIVVFSQELDKVLASLVIANGAAAMGGEVTLFFTFWGLNALRDPARSATKPKGFLDAMFGFMMPKGTDRLPITNMNFAGVGPPLLKYVMEQKRLPNVPGLLAAAKAQNVRLVACTMSMDAMGITREELIDGVQLGGVAEYLGAAEKTGTNLFI